MLRTGQLVLLCLSFSQLPAFSSTIVFSTYGPNDTYDLTRAYTVGMTMTAGNSFLPQFTGPLQEIDFALSNATGNGTVNVQLLTDSGGAPGTLIESYTVTVTSTFPSAGSVVPALSVIHPILHEDTAYWLILSADTGSDNPWYFNSIGITGPRFETGLIVPDTMATFRVIESSVAAPEPSVFVLMALGLATVAGLRRRHAAARESIQL